MVRVKSRRVAEVVRRALQQPPSARARLHLRPARAHASLAASQPPAVAAAMAPLLEAPLSELGRAVASSTVPPSDNKPDLLHWLPLLNRLDQWLEGVAARADAGLRGVASADEPFPTEEAVAVLRASAALLDFSHNRHLYGSAEVRARRRAARAGGCGTRALGALRASRR